MKGAKGFRGLKKDEIQQQANLYVQTMTVSLRDFSKKNFI